MFGFKKNEKPTLIIEAKDLMEIIKSDYDNDMAFTLIEFSYNEKKYVMGSCVLPANAEECKENISFIFQDRVFESFEEFQTAIIIDNKNILQLEKPLEILRAGIIDNEPMLKTPWGDKRLADKAEYKFMALLMFRTFGVIIVSFIVLIMYVLHRKKNGKFIKRKAVNEEEKIKYQKWEKIINVMAVVGLLILGIFITVPCCLDIPYLLSNNLVEVTGEVTQGAMSGENSNSERRIHIRDEKTGEEHSLKYWGTGSDLGDKITVRYLPHTEYGYVVE